MSINEALSKILIKIMINTKNVVESMWFDCVFKSIKFKRYQFLNFILSWFIYNIIFFIESMVYLDLITQTNLIKIFYSSV